MMKIFIEIFGEGQNLSVFQMCMRTIFVFCITLFYIRISGKRTFGMHTPMDNVITILLGALLSRAIVGASPFIGTIFSGFTIVVLYKICAGLSVISKLFGKVVKGRETLIFKNGKMIKEAMNKCMVTEEDLIEEVRTNSNLSSLRDVEAAFVERTGKISIVKKINR